MLDAHQQQLLVLLLVVQTEGDRLPGVGGALPSRASIASSTWRR
ncbi:MAG: hypothetical protein QM733_06820 [Ilumatobacteraceae bacterium]